MLHWNLTKISFLTRKFTLKFYISSAITDCFYKQDFKLENLVINAVKGDDFYAEYNDVLSIYREDFDDNRFQVQLETLLEYCKEFNIISVCTIAEILNNLKVRSHLTKVIKVVKLILVMPSTNAASEKLFSFLRFTKTYLQSTLKQNRLNHLMI